MKTIQRLQHSLRLTFLAIAIVCLPQQSSAQENGGILPPVPPSLQNTRQNNPRGTDIVEPAAAWKITRSADERADTTFLGLAKIPDPRRSEVGSTTNRDIETSVLIRLGGAWIYDEAGLRTNVTFDDSEGDDLLAFTPGPHDDIVSLQGVRPLIRRVGELIVFNLRDLYDASTLNPLTGSDVGTADGTPRIALLRMESTYRGGEAVDLSVVVAPIMKDRPAMQALRLVRRDTTILTANLNYTIKEEVHVETPWTAGVTVETGMGSAQLNTEIPATLLRSPFTSIGTTGAFYLDATIYLRRNNNRWALNAYGMSALSDTDITQISHHQVVLRADARFERGTRLFMLMQLSGEMTDKQYQEFDWDSADYAGMVSMGFGHRSFGASGYERSRIEVVGGLRMGENRRIEIFETRERSRGIGPQATVSGVYTQPLGNGFAMRFGATGRGYSIFGRGHRDEGFAEKGLLLQGDLRVGKSFLGVTTYAGISSFLLVKEAEFLGGGRYYENRRFLAPGLSVQTCL